MGTKQFDLTNRCNLGCEPCYNRQHINKGLRELSPDFVAGKVAEGDVVFLGGGETMLYGPLDELLEKIYPISSKVVVSTNAAILREVPNSDKLQIQMSLISLDNEVYRGITNSKVPLDNVLYNMGQYAENYAAFINVPVYTHNVDEMQNMAEFAKDRDLFIRFREAIGFGFSDEKTREKMEQNFFYIITNITSDAAIATGDDGSSKFIEYYSPFNASGAPVKSMHPFAVK